MVFFLLFILINLELKLYNLKVQQKNNWSLSLKIPNNLFLLSIKIHGFIYFTYISEGHCMELFLQLLLDIPPQKGTSSLSV